MAKPISFLRKKETLVRDYIASIPFDQRLYREDIIGSIAHAKMLAKQGIITEKEAQDIISGLTSIQQEIEEGKLRFKSEFEDIHMNIEARLFEKIGDVAGKLHTARSRNDQVALDLRLFTKEAIKEIIHQLKVFQKALLDVAEANKRVIMPGYTHLQRAQPVLFAHYFLAYFEMFERDIGRFRDCLKRTDVMPLGSGALAGVPYPIDREFVARELGFSRISQNSLDAVSDRDFIVEFEATASITMMHLSRLAQEIILWSSNEFGFIEISDLYVTGSSIMPHKKNPDAAELIRGKTGRIYGHLVGILTTMKALPLAYNRDMQEDKEGLFDTVDTLLSTLKVFAGMIKSLKVNAERMRSACESSYILATDYADYLVSKGVPFREAHHVVGKLVNYALKKGKNLWELNLKQFQRFSPFFSEDIYSISLESVIAARKVLGGTALETVEAALAKARGLVEGEGGEFPN